MVKMVLVVAVILGAAWSYGPTRQKMTNALVPVAERLGPVGELVLTPIRNYATQTEIEFIADQIEMHRTEGREVPNEKTFQSWMKKRVKTRYDGRDAWGTPYFLLRREPQWTVGSAGRDGERGTADDIREPVVF